VRIIHIDPERRRMGLSMKQVDDQENWAEYKTRTAEEDNTPETQSDDVSQSQVENNESVEA
jgi:ribosomal protein S1